MCHAGEHRRQAPRSSPGPAVRPLDHRGVVAGEAVWAVAGRGGEHPAVRADHLGASALDADRRGRWVAFGQGAQAQTGGLAGGEPGRPREHVPDRGVEVHHQAERGAGLESRSSREPGEGHHAGWREVEAVRKPQQKAGQGLVREGVEAAGQRPDGCHQVRSFRCRPPPWAGPGRRRRCSLAACRRTASSSSVRAVAGSGGSHRRTDPGSGRCRG